MRPINFLLSVLLCLAMLKAVYGAEPDVMRASCRVISYEGGRGSGCVFHEDAENYYVLTNAHVAGSSMNSCEFWRSGRQSIRISAPRVFHRHDKIYDVAILRLSKKHFGGFRIPVIPLAKPTTRLESGRHVLTVGCANATWQTLQSGHVRSAGSNRMTYVPQPAPGRSGSPLFSSDGKTIVGLVGWRSERGSNDGRNPSDGHGLAMPVSLIWKSWAQAGYRTQDL